MNTRLASPWLYGLLLLLFALPYWSRLGSSSLWDANESFYAETPREMLETGDYLAPQFNYEPRVQKPPLTYWVILASYRLFGINELSVRLPGAAAALGVIVFTFLIGRRLFNARAALMAAFMTATTVRIFVLARKLPIDILLLFLLLGTAYFLIRAATENSTAAWIWTYLFAGLAFMTKGPIAWIIPGLAYLIWSLWSRRFRLAAVRPVLGLMLLLVIVLPWYVLVYVSKGESYVLPFFLRDNLGRFASESFGPARGPFYYVLTYLADFFPWSILSLAALLLLWRMRKQVAPLRSLCYGFPLVWCGVVFLLFSLSKNKQEYYIVSMYPMAAVLSAGLLEAAAGEVEKDRRASNYWNWAFGITGVLLLSLAPVSLLLIQSVIPNAPALLHYGPAVVLGATSGFVLWSVAKGRRLANFFFLAGGLWITFLLFAICCIPALEGLRPVKDLCKVVAVQAKPRDEVGYFRATVPSMAFYLRRRIFEEFDPGAMTRRFQSDNRVFCLLTEQEYNYFVGSKDLILYVLDRRPRLMTNLRVLTGQESWTEQDLLLVSNKPSQESESEGHETP